MAKRIFRPIDVPWGSNEPLMVVPRVVKVQEPGILSYEYTKVVLVPVEVEIIEDDKETEKE